MKNLFFLILCIFCLAFTVKENTVKPAFCSCFPLTENNICNLKERVEFMAIGTITESTHLDYPDGFTDVEFKIDSLIKGPQTKTEIY